MFVSVLAVAAGALPAGAGTPDPVTAPRSAETLPARGLTRLVEWRDSVDKVAARALVITEWSQEAARARVLAEPGGAVRFVLDRTQWPIQGRTQTRFYAERSGWWAELEEVTNLRLSMDERGDPAALAVRFMEEDRHIQLTLRAAGGVATSTPKLDWVPSVYGDLAAQMEADGLAHPLVTAMPAAVRQGLRSLLALSRFEPGDSSLHELQELLVILESALDLHEEAVELSAHQARSAEMAGWTQTFATGHAGAVLEDPEELRFAKRFRSIDPTRPMPLLPPNPPIATDGR
jgi:hypothetical protein